MNWLLLMKSEKDMVTDGIITLGTRQRLPPKAVSYTVVSENRIRNDTFRFIFFSFLGQAVMFYRS
jgi:hypothetical protein